MAGDAANAPEPTRIPMGGVDKCLLCGWQGDPTDAHDCRKPSAAYPREFQCPECGALVGHWQPCSMASPELQERWRKRSGGEVVTAAHPRDLAMNRPFFRILWIGRGGFGLVWCGVEHQFYRDLDGSMGKRLTHTAMPWLRCGAESDA